MGLLDGNYSDGDYSAPDAMPFLIGASTDAPAPVPAGASAAPAPAADGGSWKTTIDDFVGLLGKGVGAGGRGMDLAPAAEKAANMRALMAFGTSMLANSGPSTQKRGFGQILAAGLDAAGQVRGQAEYQATAAQQADVRNRLALATLGLHARHATVEERDAAVKEAEQRLKEAKEGRMTGGLGAIAGAALAGLGAPAGGAEPLVFGAPLPPPQPRASADFTDPNLPAVIETRVKAEAGPAPLSFVLALAKQESGGTHDVAAGDGGKSVGAFQIGPDEAASVGVADRTGLIGNVSAGVRYINSLWEKYRGDPDKVALAYNAGQARADAVLAGKATVPDTTRQYIANVRQMTGAAAPAPAASAGGAPAAPGQAAASWADLPPDVRRMHELRIKAAQLASDPAAALETALKDVTADIQKYHDTRGTIVPPDEAAKLAPDFHARGGILMRDGTGKVTVLHQPTPVEHLPGTIVPPDEAAKLAPDFHARGGIMMRDGAGKLTVLHQPTPVDQTPEGRKAATVADMSKKRLETYQARGTTAENLAPNLDMLRDLSPLVGGGSILPPDKATMVQQTAEALGVGTPQERAKWNAAQAFNAIVAKVSQQLHVAGTGSQSDLELRTQLQSLPSLQQSPKARELTLGLLSLWARRQADERKVAEDYFMANPNMIGVEKAIADKLGASAIPHAPPRSSPPELLQAWLDAQPPGGVFMAEGPDGKWGLGVKPSQPGN